MEDAIRLRQYAATALTGIVGVAVGAVCVAYLAPAHTAPAPTTPSSEPTKLSPQDGAGSLALRAVRHLQNRVAKIEESPALGASAAVTSERAEEPPQLPPPEERRARTRDVARQHEARFRSEALDPSWAGEAASSLDKDFAKIAPAANCSSVSVECRTSLCKGSLHWPSYRQASGSLMTLLTGPYEKNCTVTVTLPEPDNYDAPYEGNVFFDCTEDRAN